MHSEARLKLSCIVAAQTETTLSQSNLVEVQPSCIFGVEVEMLMD